MFHYWRFYMRKGVNNANQQLQPSDHLGRRGNRHRGRHERARQRDRRRIEVAVDGNGVPITIATKKTELEKKQAELEKLREDYFSKLGDWKNEVQE